MYSTSIVYCSSGLQAVSICRTQVSESGFLSNFCKAEVYFVGTKMHRVLRASFMWIKKYLHIYERYNSFFWWYTSKMKPATFTHTNVKKEKMKLKMFSCMYCVHFKWNMLQLHESNWASVREKCLLLHQSNQERVWEKWLWLHKSNRVWERKVQLHSSNQWSMRDRWAVLGTSNETFMSRIIEKRKWQGPELLVQESWPAV
jgi:hypothetical protein